MVLIVRVHTFAPNIYLEIRCLGILLNKELLFTDQTVTMDIVVMIVPKVLTHWLDIGHRLRVEEHDLQAIDAELHNDERSACRNMLRKWLGTASARTPKTWRTFVQALLDLNIDHSRVIAVLEKELIQN